MGTRGIGGLKARVEWKCCIGRGVRLNSRDMQAASHSVIRGSRDAAGGAAPGLRATKVSEFREGK